MDVLLWPALLSFVITIVLVLALEPVAWRIGWLDKPCTRKQHGDSIPLIGGAAICAAFTLTVVSAFGHNSPWALLFAANFMCLVGLWDDLAHLSARRRLIIQLVTALGLCMVENLRLHYLGDIFGTGIITLASPVIATLFTLVCIIGGINALNMIDGIDGLAGLISLSALFWLGVAANLMGFTDILLPIAALAACVIGYLVFNMRHRWRKRARIFMGDAGSTMLGVTIAWFIIHLSQNAPDLGEIRFPPIVGIWLVIVPVADTLCMIVGRLLRGESPFAADRNHMHHILLDAGLGVGKTALLMGCVAAATGAFAVLGWQAGFTEALLFYTALAYLAAHYYFVHVKRLRWIKLFIRSTDQSNEPTALG